MGDKPESQAIEQHHAENFNNQPHEVAGEQMLDVLNSLFHPLLYAVRNHCSHNLPEKRVILNEEEGNEDDGEESDSDARNCRGH